MLRARKMGLQKDSLKEAKFAAKGMAEQMVTLLEFWLSDQLEQLLTQKLALPMARTMVKQTVS